MGFFDFFKRPDFAAGLQAFANTKNAVLLDVRTPEEYRQGHAPKAVNLPLGQIGSAKAKNPDVKTPLFVYCLSGARSRQAVSRLKGMGYEQVTDLGGIAGYRGTLEG